MTTICKFCGLKKDTRLGACFDCAEAESIIEEGTDMYDNGIDGHPAQSSAEKLSLLIKKGWALVSNFERKK